VKTWILIAVVGTGIGAGAVFGVAEILVGRYGGGIRPATYAGGLAGIALALSGIPFAAMVERVANRKDSDAEFWGWWGGGLLVRMGLLMAFSEVLRFPNYPSAASMVMMGVYLAGLFAETTWLSQKLLKNEKKPHVTGQS
jgi:hypothetical protein